ncbi:hypothetical protein [Actinotalea sp.]|uniref:hypothetical protein n=1 Tax=Actinotalea sp. TaxID=1872145 RepID=UPI00356803FE
MTIWDTLQALVRRWYVLLLALAVAAGGSYLAKQASGVYWSRAEVTFLAPSSAINPNTLKVRSSDLIITAGLVARQINGNAMWNKMADPAATIVGEGVLDGWAVRLPDYGGQWSTVYSRQVLDVQVVGPTIEDVRARQLELLDRIDAELAAFQEGVAASDLVTTEVVPAVPPVYYVGGSAMRAIAMICLLSGSGALALTVLLEHRARRRVPIAPGADAAAAT